CAADAHAYARQGVGRRAVGRRQPRARAHQHGREDVRTNAHHDHGARTIMKAKILIIIGFLAAIGAIVYFTQVRPKGTDDGGGIVSGSQTEVTMLYSTEKKDWIESSAAAFQKEHPEIKLTLIGKGSLESAQGILDGKDKPTLWSPADSLILHLLESDWRTAK